MRGAVLAWGGLWLALIGAGHARFFGDPGAFWHLRAGEQVPAWLVDHTPLLANNFQHPQWLSQYWFTQLFMAEVHRWAGFDGLLLATAALLAGLFVWLWQRLRGAGVHPLLAGVLVGVGLAICAMHFYARPHLVTFVGIAVVVAWLLDYEQGRCAEGALLGLVPLFLAWANSHGGVLAGIVIVVAVLGGRLVRRQLGIVGGVVLLLVPLTPLVNPSGWALIELWRTILASQVIPLVIREHAAPRADQLEVWLAGGLLLLYLACLLGTRGPRPLTWYVPLLLAALASTRVRHLPLFALATLVVLADLVPHVGWITRLRARGSEWFTVPPAAVPWRWGRWSAVATLLAGALTVSMIVTRLRAEPVVSVPGLAQVQSEVAPLAVLPALQAWAQAHPGARLWNDANFGGFLMYYLPQVPIAFDDRCELFTDQELWIYLTVAQREPSRIEELSRQLGCALLLVEAEQALDRYLQSAPAWRLVQRGTSAVVYERR
jgi:hypothetical protein